MSKRTPFYSLHLAAGAKMAQFAGFEMPMYYSSILEEHMCVRNAVGLFDVSHMGEIIIKGKDAFSFVQKITTNDVSKLSPGKIQYSIMCYPDGGIVDDLLVYCLDDKFMLVVNATNTKKNLDWIRSNVTNEDIEIVDASDNLSLLAVQGPKSLVTLQKLTEINLGEIAYYSFKWVKLFDEKFLISRTGYTGELGYELYFNSSIDLSEMVWNAIMMAGKDFGIHPTGLGARDTLRLEKGYCLYGNDIDQTTNPLEAGLSWITKFDKKKFIGSDALLRIKSQGLRRKLVGFVTNDEKSFPRPRYEIHSNGEKVGYVTSGTISPVLGKGIGLGYVNSEFANLGTKLEIVVRNQIVTAEIVKIPFV